MDKRYVIGLDYGTDSVRAVVIDALSGTEELSEVAEYPRWSEGKYCDPGTNRFRQHPLDYLDGLERTVKAVLARLPAGSAGKVAGLGIDTTGSTPAPVDRDGQVLALKDEFKDNPNAMFVLWKDHTAVAEAGEINNHARSWGGVDYTRYEGGIYSSEWFWAKILHVLREDESVRSAAYSWVEHCDWMPAVLTGVTDPLTLKRGRCSAGHKAMWHESWEGLPSEEFLTGLDPLLAGLRERLYRDTYTADVSAGGLCGEWAERLGLPEGTAVACGAFDAHMGAVGGGIRTGVLAKIMGTSTCDMLVAPPDLIGDKQVRGICGQVDGSIIPGMIGLEAGQSGFGDVYAWFVNLLSWPLDAVGGDIPASQRTAVTSRILETLSEEAGKIPIEETGLLALDWLNGRRTPDADQSLKGAIAGLRLGSTAPKVFRALVEATAFGAKAIVDRFIDEGVAIDEVIALGGISQKSPFVMQVSADVLNKPIRVVASQQACALGAAMFAATAAGVYPDIEAAQKAMACGFSTVYKPDPGAASAYAERYKQYAELGSTLENQLRRL